MREAGSLNSIKYCRAVLLLKDPSPKATHHISPFLLETSSGMLQQRRWSSPGVRCRRQRT